MSSWKTGALVTGAVTAIAMTGSGLGGTAAAGPPGGSGGGRLLPLGANFRACDFTENDYVSALGAASGAAIVHTTGNTVTAEVNLGVAEPNGEYRVRLIQVPRASSASCVQGDPGVAAAMLYPDGNGIGSVTVSGPRRPGATGAWVFVDGPPRPGATQGEFYTTDSVAPLI